MAPHLFQSFFVCTAAKLFHSCAVLEQQLVFTKQILVCPSSLCLCAQMCVCVCVCANGTGWACKLSEPDDQKVCQHPGTLQAHHHLDLCHKPKVYGTLGSRHSQQHISLKKKI